MEWIRIETRAARWRLTGAMVVDWRIRARAETELASRLDRDVPLTVVASPSVRAFDRKRAPLRRQCVGEDGALCSFIAVVAVMQFDQRALAETISGLVWLLGRTGRLRQGRPTYPSPDRTPRLRQPRDR